MAPLLVNPSSLCGDILIPPSKSHTLRALLFALMAKGVSVIHHPLDSPDTDAMIRAIEAFGAQVARFPDRIEVEGVAGALKPASSILDAGNSGQVLRFIGALSTLSSAYTVITGDPSICTNRPVKPLLHALSQLGAFAVSMQQNDHAPIILRGPLRPGCAEMSGEDSQPVSALLIAASFLPGQTTLRVTHPGETPWIELTLHWLRRFGLRVSHRNFEDYIIEGNASLEGFETHIPGDFSTAAYPLIAALATGSEITLHNLDMDDVQGDKILIPLLMQMGASLEYNGKSLHIKKSPPLAGQTIDVGACIDALPILAVLGCFATGKTTLVGGAIARHKESDRIASIAAELRKMGACIEERADGMIITPSPLRGAALFSHHDHRIALSLAVAALAAQGESAIDSPACIQKSFPGFLSSFQLLGARIA